MVLTLNAMFHGLNSTQDQFNQVISKLGNMPLAAGYDVEEVGDVSGKSVWGFAGAVLLRDGRVLLVPLSNGYFFIYDPVLKTTSRTCASPEGGQGYWGGVLLRDGNVLLFPVFARKCCLYNTSNDMARTVGSDLSIGGFNERLIGGTLLPDGRVLMVPFSAGRCYVYDPLNESTLPIGGDIGMSAFCGAQLLPDGTVLLVPCRAPRCMIYDYRDDSLVQSANAIGYSGGSLLPNGNVLMIRYITSAYAEFDPITNTAKNVGGPAISALHTFCGCAHLGDGTIIIAPRCEDKINIYNYRNQVTTVLPNELFYTDHRYIGAIALPDGTVLLVPNGAPRCMIVKPRGTTPLPKSTCLSPYLNKY